MKIKSKVSLIAATIVVAVSQLQAAPTLSQQLDSIPAVEIPAFAVKSVLTAEEGVRLDAAVKVIRTIAVQNESALVPAVISITRAVPQIGPKIAAVAAKLSPNQAKLIAVRVAQIIPGLATDVAYHVSGSAKLTAPKAVEMTELLVKVAPASKNYIAGAIANRIPAAGKVLFSRFPNAVTIIAGGAISTTGGTIEQSTAERKLADLQQYNENGNTLNEFKELNGYSTIAEALTALNQAISDAQEELDAANEKASQPLTEKGSGDTEVGTDSNRYGAGS